MFKIFSRKTPIKNLTILYIMAFFLALVSALPAYIQSSYLESFFGISVVTWFFVAANLISVLAVLVFPFLIKKFSNYVVTGVTGTIAFLSLIGLSLAAAPAFVFLFFVAMLISLNLIWINMDIFVESFSQDNSTGRVRAIYFTIMNLAWIVSPMLSAKIIELSNFNYVFLISSLLIIPFLLIFLLTSSRIKDHVVYKNIDLTATFKTMYQNIDLRGIFWLALLLHVFYNAVTIFIPIYLHQNLGFSWGELGLMFSLMLIPFILVEIPAGIVADKYLGEKELMSLGYFIIIFCLILFFISPSTNFWFWTGLMFASRIGAALVESMREAYFFKNVDAKDIDKINVFRTTMPIGLLLGSVLGVATLMFLPINYIFLITAILLSSAFPFLIMLKDTR